MKVAIMQPYFFPYIGYWQLMHVVDQYVILNDVNYINRGWINRNRILCQGRPIYINLMLSKASQNKKINEIDVMVSQKHITKLLRTLESCYGKAPHFETVFEMLTQILYRNREEKLDQYLFQTMQVIRDYLDINTPVSFSSELTCQSPMKGEKRIIDICKKMDAEQYYNPIGGQMLYRGEHFKQEGIELLFLKTDPIKYTQFNDPFQENLSIIDMMMFCCKEEIKEYLLRYSLIYG